jgi:hypothetical protein
MSKQMPSSGDRFVRLSGDLFKRVHNPAGACDSAAITAEQYTAIMKLLADAGCSTAILSEVEHMLSHENPDLGMDARPRRAPASFASRYPDAMKIGFAW